MTSAAGRQRTPRPQTIPWRPLSRIADTGATLAPPVIDIGAAVPLVNGAVLKAGFHNSGGN